MFQRRLENDERGAALIFVAISMVAMLSITAIVIDGGQGYSTHRQMQNSADAAAIAATRALQLARADSGTCSSTLPTTGAAADNCNPGVAAMTVATKNGADSSAVSCFLITAIQARTDPLPETVPCSSVTTRTGMTTGNYAGTLVKVGKTTKAIFAKVVNRSTVSTTARAAATIQRFNANDGPWMVCGNSAIGGYNFLQSGAAVTANNPLGLKLRDDADLRREYGGSPENSTGVGTLLSPQSDIGNLRAFPVHGKLEKDCGLSSSWKGLIEPDALPVQVPSNDVPAENGKKVGQYKYKDILSGSNYGDGTQGCPDANNQVNFPSKGLDDFGMAFDQCLVPVPIFDSVTEAKGPNERVHVLAIVCLRIIPSHTSTIKYYGQFVRGSTCSASGGPTSDDISAGGLSVIKLVR
ncbi:MAG: hypothetical protein QOG87_1594 [Actinomycetota bacterium]|jgi:Flp pilus assembly protein TadG